jgi:hypothetical protein
MTKTRITPFLIAIPFVIVWAAYALVVLLNRDGMAVIMSGFFVKLIVISIALLIADRLAAGRMNLWLLSVIEIAIFLAGLRFVDLYY